MFQRIGILIVLPVVLVTALAAGVNAFLNYGKFAATLAEVESARFALVAKGVKAGVEANLNLGLQLSGLSVAQEILDRERALLPETESVLVFSSDGRILFSSGKATELAAAPGEWLRTGDWSSESSEWRAVGSSLVNPYGVAVGGVAVLYPRGVRDGILSAMEHKLTVAAAWTALATAIFSLLGMGVLLKRTNRQVESLAADLGEGSESVFAESQAIKAAVSEAQLAIARLHEELAAGEKVT